LYQLFILYGAEEVKIMVNEKFNHIPVLLNECIENLNIKPNGIYVDGTMGGART